MYPICFYVFKDATSPHILLSYTTLGRLGIVSFQVPNLAATASIDLALPPPSGQRKTAKQVTFADPTMETAESITSSDIPPASCPSKTKTAFHKGEDALTSSLSRTIGNSKEVKVGKFNHFKTLEPVLQDQVLNSPSSKTIRHFTPVNAPSHSPKAYPLLQTGTVAPSNFSSYHCTDTQEPFLTLLTLKVTCPGPIPSGLTLPFPQCNMSEAKYL